MQAELIICHSAIVSGQYILDNRQQVYPITVVGTNLAERLDNWNFNPATTWLQAFEEPYNPNDPNAMKLFRRGADFGALGYIDPSCVEQYRKLIMGGFVPVAYQGDPSSGSVLIYLGRLIKVQ